MIPYHGGPITPDTAAVEAYTQGHAFISWRRPDQLILAAEVCRSFALDNGAFTAWRSGHPVTDWSGYYAWAAGCALYPNCDFAVIPDVIDGSEQENDSLLDEWPLPIWFGAPVWHMHEDLGRLVRLAGKYPRVCIGSSGEYRVVGTRQWWVRMNLAMACVTDSEGRPIVKIHGLRMLDPAVFARLPLSSADSTNIAQNIGLDDRWKRGSYPVPTKQARVKVMRSRIEHTNSPPTWNWIEP